MKHNGLDRAPDYTAAALVTLGINLFCLLCAVWVHFGLPAVLLLAVAADRALLRIAGRRQR